MNKERRKMLKKKRIKNKFFFDFKGTKHHYFFFKKGNLLRIDYVTKDGFNGRAGEVNFSDLVFNGSLNFKILYKNINE